MQKLLLSYTFLEFFCVADYKSKKGTQMKKINFTRAEVKSSASTEIN